MTPLHTILDLLQTKQALYERLRKDVMENPNLPDEEKEWQASAYFNRGLECSSLLREVKKLMEEYGSPES